MDAFGWPWCLFQAGVWGGVLAVLAAEARGLGARRVVRWLAGLAGLAALSHLHFGALRPTGELLHHHELFNYAVGAKYFEELGYDGHYLATHRALLENTPELFDQLPATTNLHTYRLEDRAISIRRGNAVDALFTAPRWAEFRGDVGRFQEHIPTTGWAPLLVDHGYNATPFWTMVGRPLASLFDPVDDGLPWLALLDPLLLIGMVVLVGRTFGARTAWLFAVFLLANPFATFGVVGGAFLRQMWVAALVGHVCARHAGRGILAGACLAVATLDRLFPGALLLLPVLGLLDPGGRRMSGRVLVGFAITAALGLGASTASVGADAWLACWENLRAHDGAFFLNQISLRTLLLADPETARALGGGLQESLWIRERELRDVAFAGTLTGLRLALLLLGACAAWRAGRDDGENSTPLSIAVVLPFVLAYPADYYHVLLGLPLLLAAGPRTPLLWILPVLWLLQAWLPSPLEMELRNWWVSLLVLAAAAWTILRGLRPLDATTRGALAVAALLVAAGLGRDALRAPGEIVVDPPHPELRADGAAPIELQGARRFGTAWSRDDFVSVARGGLAVPIDVPDAGRYDLFVEAVAGPGFGAATVWVDGAELPGVAVLLQADRMLPRDAVALDLELAAGRHEVLLKSAGNGGVALDRVVLHPHRPRDARDAVARAIDQVLADPAELFDGGRLPVAREIAVLARVATTPAAAPRAEELTDAWTRAVGDLASRPGTEFRPYEAAALLVAARASADADLGLGAEPLLAAAKEHLPPAPVRLSTSDPARLLQEVLRATDHGRTPLDDALLPPAAYFGAVLDGALETCDTADLARLLAAWACLDLEVEPAIERARERLLAVQRPDGSFGATDPGAPDPVRGTVLDALLALALLDERGL